MARLIVAQGPVGRHVDDESRRPPEPHALLDYTCSDPAAGTVEAGNRIIKGATTSKILLIEDNEMNRDMLSRRLQKKGFEVILAADGERRRHAIRMSEEAGSDPRPEKRIHPIVIDVVERIKE